MEDDLLQKTIGEAARTAREGLGLTQAQVAEKAGMSAQVYGRIERGHMMPSVPAFRRMAVALGIDPGILLDMSAREVPSSDKDLSPEARKVMGLLRTWSEVKIAIGRDLLRALDAARLAGE